MKIINSIKIFEGLGGDSSPVAAGAAEVMKPEVKKRRRKSTKTKKG